MLTAQFGDLGSEWKVDTFYIYRCKSVNIYTSEADNVSTAIAYHLF